MLLFPAPSDLMYDVDDDYIFRMLIFHEVCQVSQGNHIPASACT